MYNNYFRLMNNKNRGIVIVNSWKRDYGDIAYNIRLYENKKNIADVIISLDDAIDRSSESAEINEVRNYLEDSFELFKNLPKLSNTSKLLQSCYDDVYSNDSDMCHIDSELWQELKDSNSFQDKDLKKLQEEARQYNLEDVLEIVYPDIKYCSKIIVVGYGDLITKFNDDRNLLKENINEYMVGKVLAEYDIKLSSTPFESYGSDEEADYMCSFSKLYKRILNKLDIPINSIITNEISDGKYEIIIDDVLPIDVRAWDQYQNVLDNINTIEELQLKKEISKEHIIE